MAPNTWINFNDGEGLTHEDLLAITSGQRAHDDDLHYGDLIAAAYPDPSDADQGYDLGIRVVAAADPFAMAIGYGAGSRLVSFAPGRVLVSESGPGQPAAQAFGDRVVRSLLFPGQSFNLAANAAGSDRWDIVVVDTTNFLEAAGGSESRDFKDAVTGALSSVSTNKRLTFPTLLEVVQGTAGAGIPATPAGHSLVAAFKVPNGASSVGAGALVYTDVIDYVGRARRRRIGVPGNRFQAAASWVIDGHAGNSASAVNPVAYWYPGDAAGNPEVRCRGVVIEHASDESPTIELVRRSHSGAADVVLQTIAAGTCDGQHRFIEAAAAASIPLANSPIWCNGTSFGRARDRASAWTFGNVDSSLALKVTAGAGSGSLLTVIRHVHWLLSE